MFLYNRRFKTEEAPPQNEEQDHDGSGGESSEEENSSKAAIPDNDLIVQILARLDGSAYREALHQDAGVSCVLPVLLVVSSLSYPSTFESHSHQSDQLQLVTQTHFKKSLNENYLFPANFPWCPKKRLPQKMIKTMPRDIDDLRVISHCQDDLHAPFGDFKGPFGFGRYENGQSRGNYSNAPLAEPLMSKTGLGTSAAARRSYDPGVLELATQIQLPSSIDALSSVEGASSLTLADQWKAELSKDPGHSKILFHLPYNWEKGAVKQQDHSGIDKNSDKKPQSLPEPLTKAPEVSIELKKFTESKARSAEERELATSCMRKWKISMKVSGVSSRSTLFPLSTVLDTDIEENTRKVFRPMLCQASLPRSTRLIWSNLAGDEQPGARSKATISSLISGKRLDGVKGRRPTDIKVGVRLNGRILMEEANEDIPSARKRKHSTRQAENEGPVLNVQCPESRVDEDIEASLLHNSKHLQDQPQRSRLMHHTSENGAVVYLEIGSQASSPSDIDRNDIISTLLKFNQKKLSQKKLKRSASTDTLSSEALPIASSGSQAIRRSNPPRFACVPLEDGLVRTVCLSAGNMAGVAVHQAIREVSGKESERRCSVCWSDEGSGHEGVQECAKCGLLAHPKCCRDKGEFCPLPDTNGEGTKQFHNGKSNGTKTEQKQWQCCVCCRYTDMKPRRASKMPSRFVDGETYTSLSSSSGGNDDTNSNANEPGPRCSLCPHRGGAMSQLESPSDASTRQTQNKWAHEVCRIWNCMDNSNDQRLQECTRLFQKFPNGSPLSTVCALCGTGGSKGSKSKPLNGLTRCAARGCFVAFHPMCALLASKVGIDEDAGNAKSARTRKTRHTEQAAEDKQSDVNDNIDADKKLCNEYTLKLVQLNRTETKAGTSEENTKASIVPIAFCGIHNPQREDAFFGCLPGGTIV